MVLTHWARSGVTQKAGGSRGDKLLAFQRGFTTLHCLGQIITSGQSQNREMMPVKVIIPVMIGAAAALILGVALIKKIWHLVSRR